MNALKLKAQGKKTKYHKDDHEDDHEDETDSCSETDSEENLTSDDEFDVSQDVIFSLYIQDSCLETIFLVSGLCRSFGLMYTMYA